MPQPLILCIDDEELGLQVRKLVLEREGYRVLTASEGGEGLKIFAQERVDAVVLDFYMPEMNGAAVAAEIRRLRPSVPILLLSAYINLPSEVTCLVDSTVLKGDGPSILLAKLREAVVSPRGNDGEAVGEFA
ncbi:MAG TPA: response regulator [Acidobacteriaceae bacterium]|nr:response regulator [Acidobacteriaceae bacterium]